MMPKMRLPGPHLPGASPRCDGFTRVDLIATVLMLLTLSFLFVPSFAHTSIASLGNSCIDNQRQIGSAWQQYAADHSDRVVNNFTVGDTYQTISNGQFDTWALNVVDWTTTPSNTNLTLLQNGKLFPYLQGNTLAFKCPADTYRSPVQTAAGWRGRLRSYAMNAYMGKTGANDSAVTTGQSSWYSGKRQFLKTASIPDPGNTVVFLDEHPDSINDGFFVRNVNELAWLDLPGSQHNGGCGVGFADGHGEIHNWVYSATKIPVRYSFTGGPSVTPATSADSVWLASRLTVHPTALAINRRANGTVVAWSALGSDYIFETTPDLSIPTWTPVEPKPITDYGTKSVTNNTPNTASFFRLHK